MVVEGNRCPYLQKQERGQGANNLGSANRIDSWLVAVCWTCNAALPSDSLKYCNIYHYYPVLPHATVKSYPLNSRHKPVSCRISISIIYW